MQYQVNIIESEAGWGQKVDETRYFDTLDEAQQFVRRYNSYNDKPQVPAWYMYADAPVPVPNRNSQRKK